MSDPAPQLNSSEIRGLVEQAQEHNKAAFEELYRSFYTPLHRYLFGILNNREDAEEAYQEALFNTWTSLPTLRSSKHFRSWLYKIATNAALARLRKQKSTEFPLDVAQDLTPRVPFEERLEEAELITLSLAQVPLKYRISLLLHIEGFPHHEIASILEISEKSVSTYISSGRKVFRQAYKALNEK